jgi:hypothetical protein
MIQGKNRISVKMNKGKHGRLAMQKYHAMGKPCPIAVSVGHAPQLFMAAQLPMPAGVEEYGVAGWLSGTPIEVIVSEASGLPLPAFGEIVLEGEVPPYQDGEPPKEGPFGEWPGYYADTTVGEVPVMEVKRIYYRNDPIMLAPRRSSRPTISSRCRSAPPCFGTSSSAPAFPRSRACGVTSMARRAGRSPWWRSAKAMRAMPSRRCWSLRAHAPAPTAASSWWWSTTTSTSPISLT